MNLRLHKKQTIYDFCEYILALCMIINCRSMWLSFPDVGRKYSYIVSLLCVLSALVCILIKGKFGLRFKNALLVSVGLVLYLGIYILVTHYNVTSFLLYLTVTIFLVYFYFGCYTQGQIPTVLDKYSNIVSIVALLSFIIWLAGPLLGILKPTGVIYTTWSYDGLPRAVTNYYNIQFAPQTLNSFSIFTFIPRNTSFFTEAPMASFHFSLALMIECFLKTEKNRNKIICLVLANIATLSSTGYLVMIAVFIVLYISNKPKMSALKLIRIILIPVILIVAVSVCYCLVMDKLGNRSGSIRIDDFIVGFKAWKNAPIFGNGYENNDILKYFMSKWRNVNMGFSNSLMQLLAQGGVYVTAIYLLAFINGVKKALLSKNIKRIAFAFGFIAMFIITMVTYQYIVVLIVIYMLEPMKKTNSVLKELTSNCD